MTEKNTQSTTMGKVATFVLICFFLSGISGLLYEILWTRMIIKIIGCAPFAVSIVLTIFMAGLGLGSYLAGRIIDKISQPAKLVKTYGLLELIIAVYGIILPFGLIAFKPIYAILYNRLFQQFMLYNILTFAGCFILLFIPVICMGATLPILCRFYVNQLSHLGTRTGRLYGLNTVGAAVGALSGGFWLISFLGIWGTLAVAITINSVIGLACVFIKIPESLKNIEPELELQDVIEKEKLKYPAAIKAAMLIFAISGFCSMAYEVIWTKLLGLIVGPTTYSFTIVLVTFISGLAIGSMIFGKLADKTNKPLNLLIGTQVIAALFALGVSQLFGNSQMFFAKLIDEFKDHFAMLNIAKAMVLWAFMLIPTLCLGATFPLVGKIYTQSISKIGKSIGFAYAINTIGAVLGSFCAGFVLIPLLGKEHSISLVVTIQLLSSLIIAAIIFKVNKESIINGLAFVIPAVAGLVFCMFFPAWDRLLLSEGKYHRFEKINSRGYGWFESLLYGPEILKKIELGKLEYYGDGIGGFTTVLKKVDAFGNFNFEMINSGKADASSRFDMETQTLLANLPMLFQPDAKNVMVIGLASGITAGDVLNYPIEQLDVVEISQQVVKGSDFFKPWNNNVLSNPKTNLIIQDARAHLQLTNRKYDVIISEPSNPWMEGLSALFTYDFFSLVKEKLNEDGTFVQWIHSYQMDWDTFSLIGRTFATVFPNGLLVLDDPSGIGNDFMLVGFKSKNQFLPENAQRNFAFAEKSTNAKILNPNIFYRMIVSEDLNKLFGQGVIDTDSRPRLEFSAPKMMYRDEPITILENINQKKWISPGTTQIVEKIKTDIDVQIDFAAYALSIYKPFSSMVDLSKATPFQKDRYFKLMEDYVADNPIDYSIFTDADKELAAKCYAIQIDRIKKNLNSMPDKRFAYSYLANLYYSLGMLNESLDCHMQIMKLQSNNAESLANIGTIFLLQGKIDDGITKFIEAVKIRPDLTMAYMNLGFAYKHQKRFDQAVESYSRAVELMPENPKLQNDFGVVLVNIGKFDEAAKHFKQALRINPDYTDASTNLADVLIKIEKNKF